MDRIRVVFLWDSLRRIGGIQTFIRNCLSELPRFGIDPCFIETKGPTRDDVSFKEMPEGSIIEAFPRPWQTPIGYRQSVVRKIALHRPHALITNDQVGWEFLPTFHGKIPIIDIFHADFPNPEPWQEVEKQAARLEAIVAVSERIKTKLERLPGIENKVLEIPCGVPAPPYVKRTPPTKSNVHVVYVGRLLRSHKRVQDLVPFYESLSKRLPGLSLTIIGDGPERAFLEKSLNDGTGRVRITGALALEEIARWHQRSHYFIQCSEFEGLSIALLEAMGSGVVPVVTDIESGVRQVVDHGENGCLYAVGDPGQAAELICNSMTKWSVLSLNAANKVAKSFSLEQMYARYNILFRRVARSPLNTFPRYVDETFPGLLSQIVRRTLPISIYSGLLGRVV